MCLQLLNQMDPPSTQEVKPDKIPHQITPPHRQILHLMFHQTQLQHQKPSQKTGWKLFFRCRKTDPFCKHISKCLSNGKAPQLETDLFTCIKGLLYKHIMDSRQKFLALVIPKSWKYTVPVEAHDKLGHQGNTHTYCLTKRQYYWKGMNNDIWKYIANCTICHREKAKIQNYPLQMMDIPTDLLIK